MTDEIQCDDPLHERTSRGESSRSTGSSDKGEEDGLEELHGVVG
jgi:hypothetical protein